MSEKPSGKDVLNNKKSDYPKAESDFDEISRTREKWNEYFKEKYGKESENQETQDILGIGSVEKVKPADKDGNYEKSKNQRSNEQRTEGGTKTLSGQWKKVNESMSDFSRTYQKHITGQEGMAWVQNGVKFDGMKDGFLIDAKGKYAQFINKNTGEFYDWFSGKQSFVDEAIRQIDTSEGAKIQWYFAEEETLNVIRDLFMEEGISEIELLFEAPE